MNKLMEAYEKDKTPKNRPDLALNLDVKCNYYFFDINSISASFVYSVTQGNSIVTKRIEYPEHFLQLVHYNGTKIASKQLLKLRMNE